MEKQQSVLVSCAFSFVDKDVPKPVECCSVDAINLGLYSQDIYHIQNSIFFLGFSYYHFAKGYAGERQKWGKEGTGFKMEIFKGVNRIMHYTDYVLVQEVKENICSFSHFGFDTLCCVLFRHDICLHIKTLTISLSQLTPISSRHTHACNPVPLDLDKCGSVQISDSVEDNHCEVSDSDSDGMTEATETSDDTNRRKASRMSNKVSSAVEPESSQSGWSQHGRGSSCSPSRCVALSDRYIEKSHKHSKYPSSSLACELQEATTREYHPSKGSKSRCVKPSTRDGRYCERRRGIVRKHSDQQKKSNDMPYLKTRLTDEDASHAIDVKRLYNRHINHGKQRAMVSFDSNENDMPYRSQSERYLTYSGGVFPDSRLGPAYLKNQCRNIHPSCRYKSGWPDGYHISERQNFRGKKSSQIDNEALEDDWYQNHWRHPVQGNIEGSRKLTPKYSSSAVNRRGAQFIYQGDGVHFRRRTIGDDLSPLHKYDNKFVEGKYRRIWPSIGRDRGHLDHRCDRNIAHDRREMESSGRGERRRDSPLNCLDNLWNIDTEVNGRRNIKHQPFPFYCPEEPCAPGRGQFAVASGPKSGVPERNVRCSWKEMCIESGRYGTNITTFDTRRRHYQQSSSTYVTNESFKDDHDFVRRRHHQHSDVLHSREEVHKSRQQDDTMFHSEGPSYHFRRFSRNNGADDRHAFGHVAELIDEREVNRQRSKMLREEDHSNQFDRCHKSNQSHNHAQMLSRYQDSVERLVFVGKKVKSRKLRSIPCIILLNIGKCLIFVGQANSIKMVSSCSVFSLSHCSCCFLNYVCAATFSKSYTGDLRLGINILQVLLICVLIEFNHQ